MNIDEYRALKAQETKPEGGEGNAQVQQEPIAIPQEVIQETQQVQPLDESQGEQTPVEQMQTEVPSKIKFGDEEYEVEQLIEAHRKATEYEQQLQSLTRQSQGSQTAQQYYEAMMSNPEYAKVFAEKNNLPFIDPQQQAVQELEQRYNDLLLEREIENLQIKYKDFDAKNVIQLAVDKGINNLEDAYLLSKATTQSTNPEPDITSLKEQIRQEILNELQSNVNTGSLIGATGGGAKPVTPSTPQLTPSEIRVARGMGISPEEYMKFKNSK